MIRTALKLGPVDLSKRMASVTTRGFGSTMGGSSDVDPPAGMSSKSKSLWSDSLRFASPESDFVSNSISTPNEDSIANADFIHHIRLPTHQRASMAYALSFVSPDSDFSSPLIVALLDDRMKEQLHNARTMSSLLDVTQTHKELMETRDPRINTVQSPMNEGRQGFDEPKKNVVAAVFRNQDDRIHEGPLPQSIEDALRLEDPRAIVVTEAVAPFRIISVNPAWEALCGFSFEDCKGKTLRCIQGPETDSSAVTALMAQLLRGEEAGTLLTNYTKQGRKFQNRLRVRPLMDPLRRITHFVGVLREVVESGETFAHRPQAHSAHIAA